MRVEVSVGKGQRSAWGGVAAALAALVLVRENTLDSADVTRASIPEPCLDTLGRGASVDKAESNVAFRRLFMPPPHGSAG